MIPIAKPQIGQTEKDAVMAVMDSGMLANGTVVADFETEFSRFCGAEFGIATTSGTTALEVALRALGIGVGDKVITTAYSFIASTNSILYTGATPIFADIDQQTFNIDPVSIEQAVAAHPDAKALLVVHLFGQPCDMDAICAIAKKNSLLLIEDCAQAHGSKWKGQVVGSFGDAACFSFYPTKNMTTGEGGMVVTSRPEVADRARLLINHGMRVRYTHEIIGYNYRMTNIAAAIGLAQFARLAEFNAKRQANARYFDDHLANPLVRTPVVLSGATSVYHQYTIRVLDGHRDAFVQHLEANGVGYGIFYPFSIPEQPAYKGLGFSATWPVTDEIKQQVVSIPVHPGLSEEDVAQVAKVINEFKPKGVD